MQRGQYQRDQPREQTQEGAAPVGDGRPEDVEQRRQEVGPLLGRDAALLERGIRGGGRERVHQGEAKKKPGLLKPAAAEEAEI